MQVKKQQLELDMEQQNGSKLDKVFQGYALSPAYLTYMQGISGEGNGSPLQYSCLENPMDAVHGVAESRMRLNDFTFIFHFHALEKEMANHSSVLA